MARRNRIQLFFAFMDFQTAFLCGLPHLLYTARLTLPGLVVLLGGSTAWELPANGLFALAILYGLLRGLRQNLRNPPRWIGAWAGYALLLVMEAILAIFPGSPAGTFGGILWLVGYSAALIYLGRGDRLRSLLAALPVAPVFIWSLTLDSVLASPAGLGYALIAILIAGLVMAAASALFESFMWGRQAFWTVVIATLIGGLPVAIFRQNFEKVSGGASGGVPAGSLGLAGSLLGYLVAVGVFSWPVWVGVFWDWVKRKVTTGV